MKKILVIILTIVVYRHLIAQQTREELLQQLKSRDDFKVEEIEKDLLRIEYPGGKVMYKNTADYKFNTKNKIIYSPTYDSTIIDLTTINAALYAHKYRQWQVVPIHNWKFNHIMIGDVNKNGNPELYGARKFFTTDFEPVSVYELNNAGYFELVFQYDSMSHSRNIYDVDMNGEDEVHLSIYGTLGINLHERFFSKSNDTSLATQLNFIFEPYQHNTQLNDLVLDNLDGDEYTDLLFARANHRDIHIFEYNPSINNFDSVYSFDVYDNPPYDNGGFSINDFDMDSKKDMVFGTLRGSVYVLENEGDNQYTNSWLGSVETYHAYVHTWTKDIDNNGRPEFWILGDAFYSGVAKTRITIFETNGDNSYQAVGRIDLLGIFSFHAGTMQAVDIDRDGVEEVAVCIDENFLILKFNGSTNYHSYEVYYIERNERERSDYYGATVYDLLDNSEINILISMDEFFTYGTSTFYWRFTQILKPDNITTVKNDKLVKSNLEMYNNYPNPFNPTTTIRFGISRSSEVSIRIFNILGKEIRQLLNENLPAGEHNVQWDGKDIYGNTLPAGVYFIRVLANSTSNREGLTQKIIKAVLIK